MKESTICSFCTEPKDGNTINIVAFILWADLKKTKNKNLALLLLNS